MNKRTFIVEDSITVRMDLREALEDAGFDCVECASLAQARAALEVEMARTVEAALDALKGARNAEGAQLAPLLADFIARIEGLVASAEGEAQAQVAAIRDRFSRRMAELAPDAPGLEIARQRGFPALAVSPKGLKREQFDEAIADYIRLAIEDGDPGLLAAAL